MSSLIKRAWSRQINDARQWGAPDKTANPLFQFFDPGLLRDDDLQLIVMQTRHATLNWSPQYIFHMTRTNGGAKMGSITLRIGDSEFLTMYAGQIGYGVEPAFRGHHLAARSVQLLLPLARRHGLNPLWITCNPDNFASRRSCEIAGGQMIEIVDLPTDCDMYREGERQKCRYRFEL